jgi:ketosteroid isomerase-like protein
VSYAADRAEIEDLMARYLFAMDYHDADTYAECFTEDGELDWAMGVAKGRDAIRDEALSFKERIGEIFKDSEGGPAKLRHAVCQKSIRVDGDRAWNTGLWFEMTNGGADGSIALPSFGIYEDELARIDGSWLFTRRKIYNEFLAGRQSGPVNPVLAMDAAPAD